MYTHTSACMYVYNAHVHVYCTVYIHDCICTRKIKYTVPKEKCANPVCFGLLALITRVQHNFSLALLGLSIYMYSLVALSSCGFWTNEVHVYTCTHVYTRTPVHIHVYCTVYIHVQCICTCTYQDSCQSSSILYIALTMYMYKYVCTSFLSSKLFALLGKVKDMNVHETLKTRATNLATD